MIHNVTDHCRSRITSNIDCSASTLKNRCYNFRIGVEIKAFQIGSPTGKLQHLTKQLTNFILIFFIRSGNQFIIIQQNRGNRLFIFDKSPRFTPDFCNIGTVVEIFNVQHRVSLRLWERTRHYRAFRTVIFITHTVLPFFSNWKKAKQLLPQIRLHNHRKQHELLSLP
nr:MAG TPA: hypothetical protein [Caudoviricetes sp.]